jgi:hypothetical protein
MNLCVGCGLDFSTTGSFDDHRVGTHDYTWFEGLRMDPPREDGRRCLDVEEMEAVGWDHDARGRWRSPNRTGNEPLIDRVVL